MTDEAHEADNQCNNAMFITKYAKCVAYVVLGRDVSVSHRV